MGNFRENFVYSKKDLMVAGTAAAIVVVMLGLGFGLTSGASIQQPETASRRGKTSLLWSSHLVLLSKLENCEHNREFF